MTLPITWIILIPMVCYMVGILCCSLVYRMERLPRRSTKKANIYRCSECNSVYVDLRKVPLTRCPHCRCLNEAIKR
ncbi:MAG: transposase-like protein [Kiritimatiellia bacterium]|jgi:transposase-like protein